MKALISVSDKTGIVEFAKELESLGIEIISTGGTYKKLKEENVNAIEISDLTGFPECLDGRVKTLHPRIHAGLLSVRSNPEHMEQIKELGVDTSTYELLWDMEIEGQLDPTDDEVMNDVIDEIEKQAAAAGRASSRSDAMDEIVGRMGEERAEQLFELLSEFGDVTSDVIAEKKVK